MEKDLEFWLSFHSVTSFKSTDFSLIKSKFDSIEKAWKASGDDLAKVGISKSVVNHIISQRSHQDPLVQPEKLDRLGCKDNNF